MTDLDTAGSARLRAAGALDASLVSLGAGGSIGMREDGTGWSVLAWAPDGERWLDGLSGTVTEVGGGRLLIGPADRGNAAALRASVPWLRPRPVEAGPSIGLGDRLGVATPGHVAALRATTGIFPVLAQQSARELARTGRSFGDVLDGATFGALATGWSGGFGADADHLKTAEHLDEALAAGFSQVTVDPIDLVPDVPADAPAAVIEGAFGQVPWRDLEDDPASFAERYPAALDLDSGRLVLPPHGLRAAAARFGPAVVHIVRMSRHLSERVGERVGDRMVGLEVAVDELGHRTTHVDHVYLATELHRLGVRWGSLAPCFVGRFEKGVEYIGDTTEFERDLATHAAIARALGPYKISIHSGSDKYSIYPAAQRVTGGSFHLKTSGTSYLTLLATLSQGEPELLRDVWRVALETYGAARASYWVSAGVERMPRADDLSTADLAGLLVEPGAREILHVTYGAILGPPPAGGLRDRVLRAAWEQRETYWAGLAEHLGRHLRPLMPRPHPGQCPEDGG